jgi:oligopeptide/dipeptide ABC transporter ATP-binding protein
VRLEDVRTHFGAVRAVDGVDLEIARGEILGIVGESGSGKTTLGRTMLGLTKPTGGRVLFDGTDMARTARAERRRLRRRMQMVFQDPHASLSPRLRVSSLLTEAYKVDRTPRERRSSVRELLEMVDLPAEHAAKYPHELSGGQARRVGIARALALEPDLLVADEPTAGLDVSATAGVLMLIKRLTTRLGLACVLITHNLDVVGYVADRIAVMYLGRLVEVGPTDRLFDRATHPYTRALLSAVSDPDPRRRDRGRQLLLPGEIPSPRNPPAGCRFHTRCPYAEGESYVEEPQLEEVVPGHLVACHHWRRLCAELVEAEARA